MQEKRKALGRGLEQLFNDQNLDFDSFEEAIIEDAKRNDEIIDIKLEDLRPNPYQPRKVFDENALNELAISIKQQGVFQPIIVKKSIKGYEIIAGERRYKAAYIAGLVKVPAVIIDLNDNESAEVAIVENIQRRDLSPIEEAKSYKKLLDRGYLTQDQLASRMGKTQATISNKLRLLNLDEKVQDALLNNKISERHARSLLRVESKEEQREILDNIINNKLNVRETEKLISEKLGENKDNFVPVSNLSNVEEEKTDAFDENLEFPKFINDKTTDTNVPISNEAIDSFFGEKDDPILKDYININKSPIPNDQEEIEMISDFISPQNNIQENDIEVMNDNNSQDVQNTNDNLQYIQDINDNNLQDVQNTNDNMQNVIDKINNIVNEIKSMGYNVKLEEYDFEELYQFIIKIDKNK